MTLKNPLIIIDPRDNVATALRDLHKGEDIEIPDMGILLSMIEEIPFGHKVSLQEIGKGDMIMKYGEIIGQATSYIPKGSHVHIHNIESLRGRGDLEGDLS
ncbi:MAG: UxaA family hydrolase [Synergistales bacterium]|nr:UxaA family hydrolase [Synergistales bacterium]